MTDQPDLLTYAEAQASRDRAIAQVEANAEPPAWVDYAAAFIETYARSHPLVFVDDLWAAGLARPENPKALGPAILRAARSGIIEKTGDYRPSVSSHLLPKPVWRSLIFEVRP